MDKARLSECPATYFAPPERAPEDEILEEARAVQGDMLVHAISSCVDGVLLILNRYRQVLAVNPTLLTTLGVEDAGSLIGRRLGEVLNCIHAAQGPGGCGTGKVCRTCGATQAILASQSEDRPCESECLATVGREGHTDSLEFRVRATPVHLPEREVTALVLNDISSEKRRAALERVFFHDILNTIGALFGWATLLGNLQGVDPKQGAHRVAELCRRLEQEVKDQRRLIEAERGALAVTILEVTVADILGELRTAFEAHEITQGRELRLEPVAPGEKMRVDASLLLRVLTNMVKNALEATPVGGEVRVCYEREESGRSFRVHNPGVIPEEVQLRIFNRSFSTKGSPGRGLGTYSMKLFGERYLGGRVGFQSTPEAGTVFAIRFGPETDPQGSGV